MVNKCIDCGSIIHKNSTRCVSCYHKQDKKHKGKYFVCPCGNKFYVVPSRFKSAEYCSYKCMSKYRQKDKCSAWKGGRFKDKRGYIKIINPNYSKIDHRRYINEHRLVMEQHLGRKLLPNEVVHHINEKRDDNRIENLKLYDSRGKHNVENHLMEHYKHKGEKRLCMMCGKEMYVKPFMTKQYIKSGKLMNSNRFCSRKCYHDWRWNR